MLLENDIIVKEPNKLCELFNEYFVNIAKNIGTNDPILHGDTVSSITTQYGNHSSIELIKDHTMGAVGEFNFQYVSSDVIMSLLNKLNIRKATGCDNIPPKLLRIGSHILCIPLTYLVNNCIQSSCFPDMLKQAEVTPIYKKNDVMDKCNYRPISILPTISKILENVLVTQLNDYFEPIFSPRMSGFRKKHSCEDVLIDFIESAKSALDEQKHVGAVMTDLSRAFDCLPPKLLITKFHAFGVTERSCELLCSYFRDRYQRVKLGNSRSQWEPVLKGAAQGSLMGPFCYNVLCIDLFFIITNGIQMFNYADDNTIMCQDKNQNNVIIYLQDMANKMTTWFTNNSMKINPDKFNAIMFGKNEYVDFKFNGINVKSMDEVKLLGVNIDKKLNFDSHVSYLCKKTSRQVNALSRLRHIANENSKNMLYKTYIMSNFNYCSVIWNYCSSKSIIKLEKLNKRALRIVLNDDKCTYHDLLRISQNICLFSMRRECIMKTVFKCTHNIAPSYLRDLFKVRNERMITRSKTYLIQPKVRTTRYGLNSLRYDGARIWNKLHNDFKVDDYYDFKRLLKNEIADCNCNTCMFCMIKHL